MKNAISVIGYAKCTGCFGCQNVCRFDAISMPLDNEGFYKPIIDNNKCTECGVCEKKCPVLNYISSNIEEPEVYAGWSKDNDIRLNSSSGGIFSEISKAVIARGGIVFGVKWKNSLVEYSYTDNVDCLAEYRGSKYLQANVGMAYLQVKEFIKNGREVLFTGLPCQVAALKNIVKSDKLICIDLACLGIPSIKAYNKYIAEKYKDKIVTHTKFRSKSTGWDNFSVEYWNNTQLVGESLKDEDDFFYGFSPKCIYLNSACYKCKFNTIPRCGDITLADYWGVPKDLYSSKGVSAIFINNNKLNHLMESLNIYIKKQPLEAVLKGTPRLNKEMHVFMPKNRAFFFRYIDSKSFEELATLYFNRPAKLNLFFSKYARKLKKIFIR